MRERRPKRDPIFMGEPSPSLASLDRLNMVGLAQRVERLGEEIARLEQKVDRLKKIDPLPQVKIDQLTQSLTRLAALKKAAQDRLAEKVERKRKWDERNPGGAGPTSGGPRSGPRPGGMGPRPGGMGPRPGGNPGPTPGGPLGPNYRRPTR